MLPYIVFIQRYVYLPIIAVCSRMIVCVLQAVEKLRQSVDEGTRHQLDAVLDQLQTIYAARIDKIENEHKVITNYVLL